MDEKKPVAEAENAVMQQGYQTPMIETAEAQYYAQLAQQPQMDHQPAQPEHHELANMPQQQQEQQQHHHEQHEHHDLHQLQELQDSPAPQQQNTRPPVSADELQLAAQLTQGLAPMMEAAVEDQAQEQQESMPQQNGQEGQVQAQPEPNLQEQLEASLQNHEREMQAHEQELQNHNHGLQDVLPHAGQSQPHHYAQNPPPPPHLPHHLSMEHLPQAPSAYQLPDSTPPRKRSKVSRACDECRRKKIKCDAQSEANDQPCSNCRRSNAQCLFSRVPQKRGPSKGYIKELADRINTIEGKLNTSVVEVLERRASAEAFASPGLGDQGRKRPFSSVSGDGFQTPSPHRISSSFVTEHRPILPYLPDSRSPNPGNTTDLFIKPVVPMEYAGATDDNGLQGRADMMNTTPPPQGLEQQMNQVPEIEDAAFNRYLEFIHPMFPVLASSKARVQSLLWQSPLTLQSAFHNAFSSMVKQTIPDLNNQWDADIAATYRLFLGLESEGKLRSSATNLVCLQTLLMMLISIDYYGLEYVVGQNGPPFKEDILLRAVSIGLRMKLYAREVPAHPNAEIDTDSDDNVAVRAWWVLYMVDRWHAVGLATPPLINDEYATIGPGLEHLVGEVSFMLIRISYVLGLFGPLLGNPRVDPKEISSSVVAQNLCGVGQVLSWVFPPGCTDPVLHLAYWHPRLLAELCSGDRPPRPNRILQITGKMTYLLASTQQLVSPIAHHFSTLAALGVLELYRFDETRHEAAKLAGNVFEYTKTQSPWNEAIRQKLAEYQGHFAPPAADTAAPTSQNLRHLADHAITAPNAAADSNGEAANTSQVGSGAMLVDDPGVGGAAADHQQPKEEPLPAAQAEPNGMPVNGQATSVPADASQAPLDVRSVVNKGYLVWLDGAPTAA